MTHDQPRNAGFDQCDSDTHSPTEHDLRMPPAVPMRSWLRSHWIGAALAIAAGFVGCSRASTWWRPSAHCVPAPAMTLSIPPRTEAPVGPKTAITPQPLIQQLQTSGPGWLRIGESVEQRPIEAMLLGNGDRRVLLIGGIHGDEPEGLTVMEWFAEELLSDASLRRGSKVLIVRNLNPDGTAANTRTNKHGVDLNRNFPATNWEATARNARFNPGSEPASEPETRLAVQLLREFGPHRILVMHATSGRPMNNYDGPGKELARQLSQFNRYMVSDTIGYATPGSLGSYAGIDLQIPIITLELPRKIDADRAWEANKGALRQMLIWDEQL